METAPNAMAHSITIINAASDYREESLFVLCIGGRVDQVQ